jgi:hypothetical protein
MRSRRIVAVTLVVACAVLAARIAAPSSGGHFRYSAALACGVERWQVKTLQDRPHLIPVQATTVAHLVGLPRPSPLPMTRSPFERHIFSVVARVTLVRSEADQDLHLVLKSGATHMIAEAPDALACTVNATAFRRRQMAAARRAVRLCAKARIVGVAFWDFKHGQTGVAPNAIELHPILGFACLSG